MVVVGASSVWVGGSRWVYGILRILVAHTSPTQNSYSFCWPESPLVFCLAGRPIYAFVCVSVDTVVDAVEPSIHSPIVVVVVGIFVGIVCPKLASQGVNLTFVLFETVVFDDDILVVAFVIRTG